MVKLNAEEADRLVGKRIQMRRKEVGLIAQELSERIGISQQQLSRYERGTNKINLSHLIKLSTALNTPISWFFIECTSVLTLEEPQATYVSVQDRELKVRLDQTWSTLTSEQRRVLILFLDQFVV